MSDPPRILVVEDEGAIALDIRATLERLGYAVPATALRAQDAIEHAARLRPDLVLMDIRLKGEMDGIEAARRIRESLDVPVIYLTAHADPAMQERTRATEPYGYVLKPFDEQQLHIVIDGALHRHELERRLRASERWLAATLRSIGEAVIATDADWRIRFMSRAAESLTGWSVDEALDRDLAEVLRVSLPSGPRPLPTRESLGGSAHGVLRSRQGLPLAVEERSSLIRDDGGSVVGIVIALRELDASEAEGPPGGLHH